MTHMIGFAPDAYTYRGLDSTPAASVAPDGDVSDRPGSLLCSSGTAWGQGRRRKQRQKLEPEEGQEDCLVEASRHYQRGKKTAFL